MKTRKYPFAGQYIEDLLGHGRYTFRRSEAQQRLKTAPMATYMALHRLVKSGRLIMPRSGFYVIVDPQHRSIGTLPPEWLINDLMKNIGKPYYVGLLSAAQLYGAAHHQPMEFQVMIPTRSIRPVKTGNYWIRFFGKGPFDCSEITDVKTPTGYQKVSTPETTAWDLVRYSNSAAGLDNVITVISELSEKLDAKKLLATVKRHNDILTAQRLGWLLERVGAKSLCVGLVDWVGKKDPPLRPLHPKLTIEKARENQKWHLWVNAKLEPEA